MTPKEANKQIYHVTLTVVDVVVAIAVLVTVEVAGVVVVLGVLVIVAVRLFLTVTAKVNRLTLLIDDVPNFV